MRPRHFWVQTAPPSDGQPGTIDESHFDALPNPYPCWQLTERSIIQAYALLAGRGSRRNV
jgi:hypothetical protein